ncbi:MAG: sulfatase-like hydrolase/transferase, partial [Chloroflexota bacterium]
MSDQHSRDASGCYGHPIVKTPNLDALAARGVRFTTAYCNSPICVPSRSSVATGRYCHQIRSWDNAFPYTGAYPSWGHRSVALGHHVTTIGKLHYRNVDDDTGFPDQRLPMHVHDGVGDLLPLFRDEMVRRVEIATEIFSPAAGESSYSKYDQAIADEAVRFLRTEAPKFKNPWVLFCSFATPHHPLVAPQEFMAMYRPEDIPFPRQYWLADRPMHPSLEEFRHVIGIEGEADEGTIRRSIAGYYALCSYMDYQVGRVLNALLESRLSDSTRVIYTSDHGHST